ncbi:MAG: hypothetical protein JWP12_14 [Bacteroidetes bacterium]|nr:hypothetical protein [Bacteroidota bacterium]
MEKQEILDQIESLKKQYGEWSYDIPLPHGIWTKGNLQIPHTRLKRIVQLSKDLVGKPLSECRVLDLGSLDGQFSIEFAMQGAQVLGVEIREASISKAIFCRDVLGLKNLEFRQGDARDISVATHGMFDIIICSGLLYHLTAGDAIALINKMHEMSNKLAIVDTHIALEPIHPYGKDGVSYHGVLQIEHDKKDEQSLKATRLWASWDNPESFWFTRPSLVNIFTKAGFSSVYECFAPAHVNFGKPGIEHKDRCTFVAIKGQKIQMLTSPVATDFKEELPEHSLDYMAAPVSNGQGNASLLGRIKNKLKRIGG